MQTDEVVTDAPATASAAPLRDETLTDLQWARVLERTRTLCLSDAGRDGEYPFLRDVAAVTAELRLVSEMKAVLTAFGTPPLAGVRHIEAFVCRAAKDGVLEGSELAAVAETARACFLTHHFLRQNDGRAPRLAALAEALPDVAALQERLTATVDAEGNIRDDASPRLQELRQRTADLHARLREQVGEYLHDTETLEVLQDDYYTMRGDRYVLPVKAAFQGRIPGIVHGSSNTGQTVYIEPEPLIRTNNQLKLCEREVEQELFLIRKDLSARVGRHSAALVDAEVALLRLDSIVARARLSEAMDAAAPVMAADGPLRLRAARNPILVLQGGDVVPNDIVLDDGFAVLVVTGPNTGGKTVTLNTVGLSVLMAQSGFHVPASPDSRLPVFDDVAVLTGDGQNIRRGLSTFSGHLARLTRILAAAGPRHLVLLDEIVVGTEPSQGSALAAAFLETFATRGATVAVTTHYDRLKTLSYADPRFRNASVGFDGERMRPNFKLQTGLPGSSSPIAVAARLGVDPVIVARARDIAGSAALDLDTVIRDLETERKAIAAERKRMESARVLLEQSRERHEAGLQRVREQSVDLARGACQDILTLTQALQQELAAMQKDIRQERRDKALTEHEAERRRRRVREIEAAARAATPPPLAPAVPAGPVRQPVTAGELVPGLTVYVKSLQRDATVDGPAKDPKRIRVRVGLLALTVALDDLERALPSSTPARTERGGVQTPSDKAPSFAGALESYDERTPPPKVADNSCDVRGMSRDEALTVLEKRLDDCATHGQPVLWIVHGHGTGVLKQAIRDYLRQVPYVAHFRAGSRNEGGDGVTLAWVE